MSSIAQRYPSIAREEYPDLVFNQNSECSGLVARAQNSDIWPGNIAARLGALIAEHDDLDQAVATMIDAFGCDDMAITRLKKRKLHIKDEISRARAYLRGLAEKKA